MSGCEILKLEDKVPFKIKFLTQSEQLLFIVKNFSRALVSAVMNLRVPLNVRNFLTS